MFLLMFTYFELMEGGYRASSSFLRAYLRWTNLVSIITMWAKSTVFLYAKPTGWHEKLTSNFVLINPILHLNYFSANVVGWEKWITSSLGPELEGS